MAKTETIKTGQPQGQSSETVTQQHKAVTVRLTQQQAMLLETFAGLQPRVPTEKGERSQNVTDVLSPVIQRWMEDEQISTKVKTQLFGA